MTNSASNGFKILRKNYENTKNIDIWYLIPREMYGNKLVNNVYVSSDNEFPDLLT